MSDRSRKVRSASKTVLGGLGALITVLATGAGLLFAVDPQISPCLAARDAQFTGVPVLPHYSYVQYLVDIERSTSALARRYGGVVGAEVRYSYRSDDLRGTPLTLRTTLVNVAKDGTASSVVTGLNVEQRVPPPVATHCSEGGGGVLFVPVFNPRGRYRVILELYPGHAFTDRLALAQTDVFPG